MHVIQITSFELLFETNHRLLKPNIVGAQKINLKPHQGCRVQTSLHQERMRHDVTVRLTI